MFRNACWYTAGVISGIGLAVTGTAGFVLYNVLSNLR